MECLIRTLERFGSLAETERSVVQGLELVAKQVEADQDLAREGKQPAQCLLLLEGWACRYKTLEDGRRQITAFHIPGDLCDPACLHLDRLDQSTCTLTPARVASVPHAALLGWMGGQPRLRDALPKAQATPITNISAVNVYTLWPMWKVCGPEVVRIVKSVCG